jgi:hypothetical protein
MGRRHLGSGRCDVRMMLGSRGLYDKGIHTVGMPLRRPWARLWSRQTKRSTDIFYPQNFSCFENNGLFQQPRQFSTVIHLKN